MVDAKRAIDLLKGRTENLYEIVKEALEAKELLEGAGLKENHDLSLPRAAEELVQTYKRTEASGRVTQCEPALSLAWTY